MTTPWYKRASFYYQLALALVGIAASFNQVLPLDLVYKTLILLASLVLGSEIEIGLRSALGLAEPPFWLSRKFWTAIATMASMAIVTYLPDFPLPEATTAALLLWGVSKILGRSMQDFGARMVAITLAGKNRE